MKTKVCTKCKESKKLSEFSPMERGKFGYSSWCKSCFSEESRTYRNNHPEKVKATLRKCRSNNRHKTRAYELQKRYGISMEHYNELFETQNGMCLGCGKHQSELSKSLHVDHDHTTGKVRGLLCGRCNLTLSHVDENPQTLRNLAAYLEEE